MTYRLLACPDDRDIPLILSMYRHSAISPYIHIDEENYWRYVTASGHVRFYKIYRDGTFAGTAHLELIDRVLYLDIVVFPEYQRQGIAAAVLRDIQQSKLLSGFDSIRVSIDEKNTASRKLFERAGFLCTGKEDELLEYVYVQTDGPSGAYGA